MLQFIKLITKETHKPPPLGRWCSVNKNHNILDIKYKLKIERQRIKENKIDPYELNRIIEPKEKLVSNYPFIDW